MEENKNFHGEEEQLRMELPEAIAQEAPTAEASPEEEILPPAAEGEQLSIRIPEPPLRKKKGKAHYIWTTLFILMNVAVLLFTAISDFGGSKEPPDSLTAIGVISKNWYYIIFAVIAFAVGILLEVGKLSFMTKRTTGKGRFKLCVQTVLLGKYYDNITPLASGGQPFQIYHLSKNGVETGKATSVIISSFFLNQLTFIILCLAAVILDATGVLSCSAEIFQEGSAMRTNFQILRIFSYIGIALGSFLPLTVLLFFAFPRTSLGMLKGGIKVLHKLHLVKNPALTNMKGFRTIVQSSRSIKQIAKSFWTLFLSVLFSVALNCAACSVTYFTLRFFGYDIPANGIKEWLLISQLHLFISSAVSLVPTPGTSGAADLTFYGAFNELILVPGLSFTAMITWRFLSYYSYIIIGLLTLLYLSVKKKKLSV